MMMAYSPSDEVSYPLLRDLPAPQSVELGNSRGSSCNHKMPPTLSLQQFPSKLPVNMLQQVPLAIVEAVGLGQVNKSKAIGAKHDTRQVRRNKRKWRRPTCTEQYWQYTGIGRSKRKSRSKQLRVWNAAIISIARWSAIAVRDGLTNTTQFFSAYSNLWGRAAFGIMFKTSWERS